MGVSCLGASLDGLKGKQQGQLSFCGGLPTPRKKQIWLLGVFVLSWAQRPPLLRPQRSQAQQSHPSGQAVLANKYREKKSAPAGPYDYRFTPAGLRVGIDVEAERGSLQRRGGCSHAAFATPLVQGFGFFSNFRQVQRTWTISAIPQSRSCFSDCPVIVR